MSGWTLRAFGHGMGDYRAAFAEQAARRFARVDDRRDLNGIFWVLREGRGLGRHARALRSANDGLQPRRRAAKGWRVGAASPAFAGGYRGQSLSCRFLRGQGPPARDGRPKKGTSETEETGHSRGGLTTKLHAATDRDGLPVALTPTPGNRDSHERCPQSHQQMVGMWQDFGEPARTGGRRNLLFSVYFQARPVAGGRANGAQKRTRTSTPRGAST